MTHLSNVIELMYTREGGIPGPIFGYCTPNELRARVGKHEFITIGHINSKEETEENEESNTEKTV